MSKESEQAVATTHSEFPAGKAMDDNLRALYNHSYDETKHYRSYEWQITVWGTTLIGAVVSVTKFFPPNSTQTSLFRWFLYLFTVFVAASSIRHLVHAHRGLTINRTILWKLERHFQFYGFKVGNPPMELLSPDRDKAPVFWRGGLHLFTWIITILAVTIFAMYRIFVW